MDINKDNITVEEEEQIRQRPEYSGSFAERDTSAFNVNAINYLFDFMGVRK